MIAGFARSMQNIYIHPNPAACHDGFVERGCEKSQKHFVNKIVRFSSLLLRITKIGVKL